MKLSVLISTKNAANTLAKTLDSVSFADEIIVADMHSTDGTDQIAKQKGATVITVPIANHAEPGRAQAIAAASGDWLLVVDADEVVPESLKKELPALLKRADEEGINGFYLPRKNIIFGQWIQHTGWWPDYILRLFRAGSGTWSAKLHSMPDISPPVKQLPAVDRYALVHQNYTDVSDFIDRMNRYTSIQAQERAADDQPGDSSDLIVWQVFTDELCRRFFAFEGYKDGTHGTLLSLLQSGSEVTAQAKTWEKQNSLDSKVTDAFSVAGVSYLKKSLAYWIATTKLEESSGPSKLYWKIRQKLRI